VDLGWPYERIRANIRKSYRSLIQSGKKEYDTILGMNVEPLHKLHIEVAGRITRGDETWERQQEAVDAGEAFLVYLLDKADCIVGGALFHRSRDEAAYAVGVYRRELHDAPLGHLVQAFAIEHMQVLGLRWYYLGLRAYEANEKELQIAHFKEGWATHSFPRVTACIHRK
jgi:FemAB family protein